MTDGGGWYWKRAHFSLSGWLLGVCPCYSNYQGITSCGFFFFFESREADMGGVGSKGDWSELYEIPKY